MDFVDGLLNWSETLSRPDTNYFISDLCLEAMYADGWYPYTGRIKRLAQQFNLANELDFADEETLIKLAQSVLERTPRLEEYSGVEVVLCEENAILVDPPTLAERLGELTANALKESLVILGLGLAHLATMPHGCVFASVNGDGCVDFPELSFSATIVDAAISATSTQDLTFPLSISETLHVCLGHIEYIRQVGIWELWGNGDSEQGVLDAIIARATEIQEAGLPSSHTLPSYTTGVKFEGELIRFTLGSRFIQSIQRWGFDRRQDWAMLLIESCARILLSVPKNEVNPFRISAHSDEQRSRSSDSALAWRTHLTKANAGFRLMFWTTDNGLIEFANIGSKKELLIEE